MIETGRSAGFVTALLLMAILVPTEQVRGESLRSGGEPLMPWSQGYLDIYHINTGRGDSTFFLLPDGTTLLFDAGDIDTSAFEANKWPLRVAPKRPNDETTAGRAIADFIAQAVPPGSRLKLDFAVISHFDEDHYGQVRAGLPGSNEGGYFLTGITEVGSIIPIDHLIDRGFPGYDTPLSLSEARGSSATNYLKFRQYMESARGMKTSSLDVGSTRQITLVYDENSYPAFSIRGVKSNGEAWTGIGEGTKTLFHSDEVVDDLGNYKENPLSLAIVISYGDFDYFTGGDSTGLRAPGIPLWFDTETPVGAAVGEIDVTALNHHGHRDATNARFLAALRPRVLIQQSWVSDQPGGEVVHRMISPYLYSGPRDIFTTFVDESTQAAIGRSLTRNFRNTSGHVLVRVSPGGEDYSVFVLDDKVKDLKVLSRHGPYQSNDS